MHLAVKDHPVIIYSSDISHLILLTWRQSVPYTWMKLLCTKTGHSLVLGQNCVPGLPQGHGAILKVFKKKFQFFFKTARAWSCQGPLFKGMRGSCLPILLSGAEIAIISAIENKHREGDPYPKAPQSPKEMGPHSLLKSFKKQTLIWIHALAAD